MMDPNGSAKSATLAAAALTKQLNDRSAELTADLAHKSAALTARLARREEKRFLRPEDGAAQNLAMIAQQDARRARDEAIELPAPPGL
jgi:hypothetical protein